MPGRAAHARLSPRRRGADCACAAWALVLTVPARCRLCLRGVGTGADCACVVWTPVPMPGELPGSRRARAEPRASVQAGLAPVWWLHSHPVNNSLCSCTGSNVGKHTGGWCLRDRLVGFVFIARELGGVPPQGNANGTERGHDSQAHSTAGTSGHVPRGQPAASVLVPAPRGASSALQVTATSCHLSLHRFKQQLS